MSSNRALAAPIYFGPASRPCFGWLHPSSPPAAPRLGLVACSPFGYEATSTHRSLRHAAVAAAALGMPTLRFDYDGTGDSAGDDGDPARWDAWVASVNHAVDTLQQVTGVRRVALLGIRLGAAIAATAAHKRDDIAGFIAIAPIVSGKAWLRESRAFQTMMGFPPPPPGRELHHGDQEVAGFVVTAETQVSLSRLDLLALPTRPAAEMLILDRDDLPTDSRFADRMQALGARVEHHQVTGYARMMQDAHEAVVPSAMIECVCAWLERLQQAEAPGLNPANYPALVPASVAPGVDEMPVFLGREATLFGVVSKPVGGTGARPAIALLNSGAIPHGGPSRLYVRLARRWASRGFLVLRFDIAGIGDSWPRAGEPENVVYSAGAVDDVVEALKHLRERLGVTRLLAAGLCSGAYHAFKAALNGAPLERMAIVNPLTFFWKPGMSLAYPPFHVTSEVARYRRSALQPGKWMKLFSGGVNLIAVLQFILRRSAQWAASLARNIARILQLPITDDLGAELNALAVRGVAVRFIFSAGDPGETLLREGAGWTLGPLLHTGRVRIRRIEGPNHSFTPVWSQVALAEALDQALDTP